MAEEDTSTQPTPAPAATEPQAELPEYNTDIELDPLRVPGGYLPENMGTGWSQRSGSHIGQFTADAVIAPDDMGADFGGTADNSTSHPAHDEPSESDE